MEIFCEKVEDVLQDIKVFENHEHIIYGRTSSLKMTQEKGNLNVSWTQLSAKAMVLLIEKSLATFEENSNILIVIHDILVILWVTLKLLGIICAYRN